MLDDLRDPAAQHNAKHAHVSGIIRLHVAELLVFFGMYAFETCVAHVVQTESQTGRHMGDAAMFGGHGLEWHRRVLVIAPAKAIEEMQATKLEEQGLCGTMACPPTQHTTCS